MCETTYPESFHTSRAENNHILRPAGAAWHTQRMIPASFHTACRAAGFDITAAGPVGPYNSRVAPEWRLPELGAGPETMASLVGNTRSLWPHFIAWLAADPTRVDGPDPLDSYTREALTHAAGHLPPGSITRWTWSAPPRGVAMAHLAEALHLAWRSPTGLLIHPTWGPWFALRAAFLIDEAAAPLRSPDPAPCTACTTECRPALADLMGPGSPEAPTWSSLRRDWTRWLELRDACPVGREHRYSEAQIRYHYTLDRDVLRSAVQSHDRQL